MNGPAIFRAIPNLAPRPSEPFDIAERHRFDFDQEHASRLVPEKQIAIPDSQDEVEATPDMQLWVRRRL